MLLSRARQPHRVSSFPSCPNGLKRACDPLLSIRRNIFPKAWINMVGHHTRIFTPAVRHQMQLPRQHHCILRVYGSDLADSNGIRCHFIRGNKHDLVDINTGIHALTTPCKGKISTFHAGATCTYSGPSALLRFRYRFSRAHSLQLLWLYRGYVSLARDTTLFVISTYRITTACHSRSP